MSIVALTPNPHRRHGPLDPPPRAPLEFHRRLPGYRPTPLVDASALAGQAGVGTVVVKDESSRLGLPSFKILGASWAIYQELKARAGGALPSWEHIEELAAHLRRLGRLTLVAATDGNHGRAVARAARWLGLGATIFVPADMARARIEAIEAEGATVVVVDGTYDDAVRRSAAEAGPERLVISDTSWEGYEEVPRRIIEGYATMFWEIEEQLSGLGARAPDAVIVQIGVGALAAAATRHYRRPGLEPPPLLIGVEPEGADCVRASIAADRLVTLPGPQLSIMAGLNCGTPSLVAWPLLRAGMDVFVTLSDEAARQGMRDLARVGVVSGETGAVGMGALRALTQTPGTAAVALPPDATVLLLSTEGATDPEAYRDIVGREPADVDGSQATDMSARAQRG